MELEGGFACKLAQNDLAARSPSTVAQKFPIAAPNLEVDAGGSDRVKKRLTARLPSSQKADGTIPACVVGGKRTMHFVAISQRHIHRRLADGLVLLPLIRLAVDQRIECSHRVVHKPRALPLQREIRIGGEVNRGRAERAELLDGFGAHEFLFFGPNQIWMELASVIEHPPVNFIDDGPALQAPLHLPFEPRSPRPRFDRMHALDCMAQTAERAHAHLRRLPGADFAEKQDLHGAATVRCVANLSPARSSRTQACKRSSNFPRECSVRALDQAAERILR